MVAEEDKIVVRASNGLEEVFEDLDVSSLEWALNFMRKYERKHKNGMDTR